MKKILSFVLMIVMVLGLTACVEDTVSTREYAPVEPETGIKKDEKLGFDFIEMHNYVIDTLQSMDTPYFFIKENQFEVGGSEEDKNISITATCLNKTTKEDINLFLCDVLILIGQNASEQNYKYAMPSVDKKEGFYTDFGTVFNDYDLVLKIKKENGDYLYNATIKKGVKIPIDPRYILAEGYYD